jgi:hypothetical protein
LATENSLGNINYKFWCHRIAEILSEIYGGWCTIIGLCLSEESREELNNTFTKNQKMLYYLKQIRARIQLNTGIVTEVGVNEETTFNNNHTRLTDLCTNNN